QLAAAAAIEAFWPEARDPEWSALAERLRRRREESPGRELVVVLGSSRSQTGLHASRLSAGDGPLVFNHSVPGGGVLARGVVLRRLLEEGQRPSRIVLELMPLFYTEAGSVMEEGYLEPWRLSLSELAAVAGRSARPERVCWGWLWSRMTPLTEC